MLMFLSLMQQLIPIVQIVRKFLELLPVAVSYSLTNCCVLRFFYLSSRLPRLLPLQLPHDAVLHVLSLHLPNAPVLPVATTAASCSCSPYTVLPLRVPPLVLFYITNTAGFCSCSSYSLLLEQPPPPLCSPYTVLPLQVPPAIVLSILPLQMLPVLVQLPSALVLPIFLLQLPPVLVLPLPLQLPPALDLSI
jgi:hypothetical protein